MDQANLCNESLPQRLWSCYYLLLETLKAHLQNQTCWLDCHRHGSCRTGWFCGILFHTIIIVRCITITIVIICSMIYHPETHGSMSTARVQIKVRQWTRPSNLSFFCFASIQILRLFWEYASLSHLLLFVPAHLIQNHHCNKVPQKANLFLWMQLYGMSL